MFQLNPDLDQIRGIRTKGGLQEAIIKLRNEGKHVPPDPPSSIEVETKGPQADQLMDALDALVADKFGEGD